VNKSELIEAITERLGDKRAAAHAVDAVFDTITRAVAAGDKVTVTGFGIFEAQVRGARTVRNPATGESLRKKKTTVPKFRPGSQLKAVVAGDVKLPRLAGAGFKQVVSGEKKLAPAKRVKAPAAGRKTATRAAAAAPRSSKKSVARKVASKRSR